MDIILQGIGTFLGWLSAGSNSYIVALLIFAVILEAVMLPFSIKQQKNSIRQAKLRPKEMVIRKKYAGRDDKVTQQKMQAEIQELYARENYNPMSGCLPLLVQFPILIFLYQIVVNPLKYVICMTDGAISAIVGVINGLGSAASAGYTINTGSTIGVVSFINN
ncbi:MAG: membrane protein insertase YidC, partial [Clostridia bacterium]|nr:membrane protein insertase YidC [Clostridia bacterium]